MIVKMTRREQLCNEYREKYKKNWEFYTISGDSFLAGWYAAMEILKKASEEQVEVEFKDGSHQIGIKMSGE